MAYISSSTPEQKLQAAYLAHCPPYAAYEWLRGHAPKTAAEAREIRSSLDGGPILAEYVLLRRRDPLIDLGVALYGRTPRAVRRAFLRGGSGVRIAAWSNVCAHGPLMTGIWADERDLGALARMGSKSELRAMAANPCLGDHMITDMLAREGVYAELTEARWVQCLFGLATNPRLAEKYGPDRPMDGYAEYVHGRVFQDVWKLAARVPAEQEWASVLEMLLRHCRVPHGLDKEAESIIARWRIDAACQFDAKYYRPGPSFYLRTRLGDLLKPDEMLLDSEDRALRLSYWKRFDPEKRPDWPTDVRRAFDAGTELDAHEILNAAMWNDKLWRSEKQREMLHSVCWAAPDERHSMDMPNLYRAAERRFRQGHPDWFRDEEMPREGDAPRSDSPPWLRDLTDKVDKLAEAHVSLAAVHRLHGIGAPTSPTPSPRPWWARLPWWGWLGLGALAALLLH